MGRAKESIDVGNAAPYVSLLAFLALYLRE